MLNVRSIDYFEVGIHVPGGKSHKMSFYNKADLSNTHSADSQCLKRLADESRADEKMVVSLWKHEMERVMKDRICRHADLQWFEETMAETVRERWPHLAESLHPHFVTFPVDARLYQRPVTNMSKKELKVIKVPPAAIHQHVKEREVR